MHAKATKKGVKVTLTAKEAKLLRALLATVKSCVDEQDEFLEAMAEALRLHNEKKKADRRNALDTMHGKILAKWAKGQRPDLVVVMPGDTIDST